MIVVPFLTGGAAVVAAVVLHSLWLAALPRTVCPACRKATASVHYGPAALAPWLRRRWCAACGWSGWGRNGPVHRRDHPLAHDSGFYWGEERMEPDFGFRWAGRAPAAAQASRLLPEFRWAAGEGTTANGVTGPAHPSGFRFRTDPAKDVADPQAPGFHWGTTPVDPINDFRWKS